MKQTSCPTSTGARNISAAPSLLDRARKQARENGSVVWFATQHGAQFCFPSDSRTGETWPLYALGYESIPEAESALMGKGWTVEGLGL